MWRVAAPRGAHLRVTGTPYVAANRLADLEDTCADLVLQLLYGGLELGRHEVAVDVVPVVTVGGAGERRAVSTGPHLGAVGARFASKVHPHRRKISRVR